jgi:hypothetical protein
VASLNTKHAGVREDRVLVDGVLVVGVLVDGTVDRVLGMPTESPSSTAQAFREKASH